MNNINDLYRRFQNYCKKNAVNKIVFFYVLEALCGRDYLALKQDFWANKLSLTKTQLNKLIIFIEKCGSEPWQYIIRKGLFAGQWYKIIPKVFIPRDTSEQILHILNNEVKYHEHINSIMEVGVGSGVILSHVHKIFPMARLYGTDIDPEALKIANINCPKACLWLQDWVSNNKQLAKIELIFANPPYVRKGEAVDPLTKCESEVALYGNKEDVSLYYRELIQLFTVEKSFLKYILFEISTKLLPSIYSYLKNKPLNVRIFSSTVSNIKFVLLKKTVFLVNEPLQKRELFKRANILLQQNKIIVHPTDTCYGIIAKYSSLNIKRINKIKQRSEKMKIPILFSRFRQLEEIQAAQKLYFTHYTTFIYNSKKPGARKILSNKYFIQSLIKNNGPLLASSWNKHNCKNISASTLENISSFREIDSFFLDRNYQAKKPSKIIMLNENEEIVVVR